MTRLRQRESYEAEEEDRFCAEAVRSRRSRGRIQPESEHRYRTAFQRDRDRILHSRAFRRLEYKTQVFVYHEGDHHRNRLTHTLEGSQIARTIARVLRLNEDLAEAIVLAHDLGHTPFGHAGERALALRMKEHGGFDHNRQSLRVVDLLEDRYPDFAGLNLSFETREGILKHGIHWEHPLPVPEILQQPSLEAQIADHADEIAYLAHDVDDGLRAGLLPPDALRELPLWLDVEQRVQARCAQALPSVKRAQSIVRLIDGLVSDLVEETAQRLDCAGLTCVDAVRRHARRLVGFSEERAREKDRLKQFLLQEFYRHPKVREMNDRGAQVIEDLFDCLRADPARLPANVRERIPAVGEARVIADYIAGMTDRFALSEHQRLCGART